MECGGVGVGVERDPDSSRDSRRDSRFAGELLYADRSSPPRQVSQQLDGEASEGDEAARATPLLQLKRSARLEWTEAE